MPYKKLTEALSHVISSLEAVDGAAGSVSDAVNEVSSYFTSPELASLHGALSAYQSTHPMWLILLATEWKISSTPVSHSCQCSYASWLGQARSTQNAAFIVVVLTLCMC